MNSMRSWAADLPIDRRFFCPSNHAGPGKTVQHTNAHLDKDDSKEVKARMKDEWHSSPETADRPQDLHAPRIPRRP